MKIGVIGDIHFCEYASILRTRGIKYSTRLENCIKSINWAEDLTKNCDIIVYLGDFFDKSDLNSEEITALSSILWNSKPHKFLVGNHEMGINNLIFSSAHIFNDNTNKVVIDTPTIESLPNNVELCYLPYILEMDRKQSISEYFPVHSNNKRIIFSHNDISGIQLGHFITKEGFYIDDIKSSCELFINGHLHNGSNITDTIINLGNLTGQNFSEDAFTYKHRILVLDTDTLDYEFYINPYAINFYKLNNIKDIDKVVNAVITIKTTEDDLNKVKTLIDNNPNILASRIIIDYSAKDNIITEIISVDHIKEFRKFVINEIGNSKLILEELDIING